MKESLTLKCISFHFTIFFLHGIKLNAAITFSLVIYLFGMNLIMLVPITRFFLNIYSDFLIC